MKKIIATLLAFLMMLTCIAAIAEGTEAPEIEETEEIIEKIRQDSKFYELVMGNQEFLSGKTVKYEGVYKEDKLLVKATGISVKQNI